MNLTFISITNDRIFNLYIKLILNYEYPMNTNKMERHKTYYSLNYNMLQMTRCFMKTFLKLVFSLLIIHEFLHVYLS